MVEVYKTFHSNGTLDEHYYDTIANPAWFDSVSDKLEELHNYVWKKVKVPIEGGLFSEIDIDKIEEEHKIKMGLSKKKTSSRYIYLLALIIKFLLLSIYSISTIFSIAATESLPTTVSKSSSNSVIFVS